MKRCAVEEARRAAFRAIICCRHPPWLRRGGGGAKFTRPGSPAAARYLVELGQELDRDAVDAPGEQEELRLIEKRFSIVICAPSPPRFTTRIAMMIPMYASAVMTVQRNMSLPTPCRKVMTNTTMKMPEKIAA